MVKIEEEIMVIAYSCAGEGFGHAARMAALAPELSRRNRLHCFVPAAAKSYLRSRLPGFDFHWLPHFSFVKEGNRVLYLKSLARGAALAARMPRIVARLAERLREIGAEGVLSDFDPFLAWAGKAAGLPVVQFNHPGIVQRYPSFSPRGLAAVMATRLMEGPFDRRIWTSFYGGDTGPVLRESLRGGRAARGDYLLVNLAAGLRPRVLPELDRLGIAYRAFPAPGGDYDSSLLGCRGVISTAGYQTASEALFLGKPLLAIPQEGQYEQKLNARMVERCGGGMGCSLEAFPRILPRFLSMLEKPRAAGGKGFDFEEGTMRAVTLIQGALEAGTAARRRRPVRRNGGFRVRGADGILSA